MGTKPRSGSLSSGSSDVKSTTNSSNNSKGTPNAPPRLSIVNYDIKAKVVAEKLKGKKDDEVIQWANKNLNFHIQYRRNIYRWKKNPIIFKLAQEYAKLIPNADIPENIKYSRRVFVEKNDGIYKILSKYVDMAANYCVEITDSLLECKFKQISENFNIPHGKSMTSTAIINKLKQNCKVLGFSGSTLLSPRPVPTISNEDNNVAVAQSALSFDTPQPLEDAQGVQSLKNLTRQIHIEDEEDFRLLLNTNNWNDLFFFKELAVFHLLPHKKAPNKELKNFIKRGKDKYFDSANKQHILEDPSSSSLTTLTPKDVLSTESSKKQPLCMVVCASINGSHKCPVTFLGKVKLPKKPETLNNRCNYYYLESGTASKESFVVCLQHVSEELDKDKQDNLASGWVSGKNRKIMIVEQNLLHEIADKLIPDNIQLAVVEQNLFHQFVETNRLTEFMGLQYGHELSRNLLLSVNLIEDLSKYNGSLYVSSPSFLTSIFSSIIRPFTIDFINMLNKIWLSMPASLVEENFTDVFNKSKQETSGSLYLSMQNPIMREPASHYNEFKAKCEQIIIDIVNNIDNSSIVESLQIDSFADVIKHNCLDIVLSSELTAEKLIKTSLQDDIIYRKVLKLTEEEEPTPSEEPVIRDTQQLDGTGHIVEPKTDEGSMLSTSSTASTFPEGIMDGKASQFPSAHREVLSIESMLNANPATLNNMLIPNSAVTSDTEIKDTDPNTSESESIEEFKKLVFSLYLQFVNQPLGPFRNIDVYKEMSLEKIFKITFDLTNKSHNQ